MDAVEFVKTGLTGRSWTELKAIAAEVGVPAHTIRNIATGHTNNPRHNTIEPLRAYLAREQEQPAP